MALDNKNFMYGPDKHIVMYEGYPGDGDGENYYFQGSEMLFDRIVAELVRRGYAPEEIDRFWAFGHDGASERKGEFAEAVDSDQLAPMGRLHRDVKQGGWTIFDEAWGDYSYSTQGQIIPTVTICRPSAFGRYIWNDQEHYATENPYRTGEAVVLEVELNTVFR